MVTLDVRNAFNTAPWEAIVAQLEERGLPEYLVAAVKAYLLGRRVMVGRKEVDTTHRGRCLDPPCGTCYTTR